jgi:hypothetical protein
MLWHVATLCIVKSLNLIAYEKQGSITFDNQEMNEYLIKQLIF